MPRIIISHSHSDKPIADELEDFLRTAFPDLNENDIFFTSNSDSGPYFPESISGQLRNNLRDARALIALITTESLRSSWITFEIGSFWTRENATIVPILGSSLTASDLPGPLKDWRSIIIKENQADEQLDQVINQLEEQLGIQQVISSRRKRHQQDFITRFRDWN
ncbi:MAG: toll/interleukin-1 receptor domain-containing protein, partial [Xenococcus sp. (in: cyanobacteria)]